MPLFIYTAMNSKKETVKGSVTADTLRDAREILRTKNLMPTKIEEQSAKTDKNKSKARNKNKKVKLKKLGMAEKIEFTNTLYILSKTGISIVEALLFVEMNVSNENVQNVAHELRKHILSGANLSEAIAKHPKVFDQIFSGLIKAGEETGELDSTLARMVELLDKQDKLRSKVISTMMYPVFVIVLASIVTLVMLTFVFPTFKDMFDDMGKDLPLITSVLMDIGVFLKTYWYFIPIGFGSITYSIFYLFNWPPSRKVIDKMSLKIPLVNVFVIYSSLSNFIAVLRVAFDAGVPIVDSLLLSNTTVENYIINKSMRQTAIKIQQGQSLSNSMKATGVIPNIVMCMIATGEQSGQLGEMLEYSSIYIDTQLDRIVDALNKMVEPIMLIVIGGIVLVLALALYLPLFQSYSGM